MGGRWYGWPTVWWLDLCGVSGECGNFFCAGINSYGFSQARAGPAIAPHLKFDSECKIKLQFNLGDAI